MSCKYCGFYESNIPEDSLNTKGMCLLNENYKATTSDTPKCRNFVREIKGYLDLIKSTRAARKIS